MARVTMNDSSNETRVRVAKVGGAGHNMMVDNPVGFVEALLAVAADHADPSSVDPFHSTTRTYGYAPLMRGAGLANWAIGDAKIEAKLDNEWLAGCSVQADNQDGTFQLSWPNGSVTSHPGYLIRRLQDTEKTQN